jgi:hypothetical protein
MKLIAILSLVFIQTANAGVFRGSTDLPVELQDKVLEMIKTEAECVDLNNFKEIKTTSIFNEIDQGIWDKIYTTELRGIYYYDGYHPAPLTLIVKTEENSISNPNFENMRVLEFSPRLDSLCEYLF